MITEMIFLSVFWLNAFPHRLGVSTLLSPRTIVTGLVIDYAKHCRVEFGQYVQTHEKHDKSMARRTIGALALHPTGNQQGGYYFYSLMTGQRLHRTHWTELPMPAEVKDRVHALARRAKAQRGLRFTDSDDNDLDALYLDDDDNSDYTTNADDNSFDGNNNSDSTPDDTSSSSIPDLPGAPPLELAGVNNIPVENTGVDEAHNSPDENAGVDEDHIETTGMDENRTDLEEYVQELESILDNKIANILEPTNDDGAKADTIRAGATREQATADVPQPGSDNDSDDDDDDDDDAPLPRLRKKRAPTYGHLKGRDSDGSLPTIARPQEFRTGTSCIRNPTKHHYDSI
jgi:hypothetical protein